MTDIKYLLDYYTNKKVLELGIESGNKYVSNLFKTWNSFVILKWKESLSGMTVSVAQDDSDTDEILRAMDAISDGSEDEAQSTNNDVGTNDNWEIDDALTEGSNASLGTVHASHRGDVDAPRPDAAFNESEAIVLVSAEEDAFLSQPKLRFYWTHHLRRSLSSSISFPLSPSWRSCRGHCTGA